MNSQQSRRVAPLDQQLPRFFTPCDRERLRPLELHELSAPLRTAIMQARQFLLASQRRDGSWFADAEGDASLAAQLIMLATWTEDGWDEIVDELARAIDAQQLTTGAWSRYPGGPVDLSVSVQAYLALKLARRDPAQPTMVRARQAILQHGGADACDTITRYWLALLGQIDFDHCPSLPVEWLMLPTALQQFALRHWLGTSARSLAVPLALVWCHRPVRKLAVREGVRELFVESPALWPTPADQPSARTLTSHWRGALGKLLNALETRGLVPLRCRALDRITRQLECNSAQQPDLQSWEEAIWNVIALKTCGHDDASSPLSNCQAEIARRATNPGRHGMALPKPTVTAFADTALGVHAMAESGAGHDEPAVERALDWLAETASAEVDRGSAASLAMWIQATCQELELARSDSSSLPPQLRVLDVLGHQGDTEIQENRASSDLRSKAVADAAAALQRLQRLDGGWGSPEELSVSSPDVTGIVLESLACIDSLESETRDQAIDFLRRTQKANGSWASGGSVRFVYGTSLAIRGLVAAGVSPDDPAVAAGVNWLLVHQLPGGGWGEAPGGAAAAAASQTAWALLALLAARESKQDALAAGLRFLIETQEDDGGWEERLFTEFDAHTGRWYRNAQIPVSFALLAMSRAAMVTATMREDPSPVSLRLVGQAQAPAILPRG